MRYLTAAFFLFFFSGAFAQMDPVQWTASLSKVSETEYELTLTAKTQDKWVVYSQFDGPKPTIFEVDYPEGTQAIGAFKEPDNPIKKMDAMFDMVLTKYKGPASFTQRIQSTELLEEISGSIYFMTCDDSRCLPPKTIEFSTSLK